MIRGSTVLWSRYDLTKERIEVTSLVYIAMNVSRRSDD
jgi:hypothetical protein